ncbi:septum site-determining protein Ssd [Kineococcus rhizosphaerae]|uniref:Secretion/DNA translocation related CpaE-like protein n=1 Tax=Kineococcus rhizosphaerae TaxID=559628 RepID=A0A2T0R5P0_9ACTN|nr:septum site-determining protein Ssd [Kineococcus rhizosphaerae]PRY16086.1 secretion/DNA translocation related CpaE-like protein [Kineococcus rhizosphaerae]
MPVRHQDQTRRARRPVPAPGRADAPGVVVLLTGDEELATAVTRLAAAAGCVLRRTGATDGDEVRLVLAGVDADPADADAARRGGAQYVVVGRAPVPAPWWQRASTARPDHAVVLPEAQEWLLERLSDVADGPGGRGRTVAVVGGTGGAGASVLAAGLARALAETTGDCLLLDADPRSGGLDLLVGADALPGLRWGDLAGVEGRLGPRALRSAVDLGAGLRLLATDRRAASGPDPAQLWTVVDAARRTFAATVLDLPRGVLDGLGPVLGACDEVLLVTPGTTRGAAAASAVLDDLRRTTATPVRLVVRDVGAGPDPEDVADVAGAPLAGVLRPDRDLDTRLELGEGVPGGRRSSLRVFAMSCARDWTPA